jgi:hypothetical protein
VVSAISGQKTIVGFFFMTTPPEFKVFCEIYYIKLSTNPPDLQGFYEKNITGVFIELFRKITGGFSVPE